MKSTIVNGKLRRAGNTNNFVKVYENKSWFLQQLNYFSAVNVKLRQKLMSNYESLNKFFTAITKFVCSVSMYDDDISKAEWIASFPYKRAQKVNWIDTYFFVVLLKFEWNFLGNENR